MPDSETSCGDVDYDADTGTVKLTLRRPVYFKVPSKHLDDYDPKTATELPTSQLTIDWVYGYRGRDGRNNILVLQSGEVCYFIAAVAVLYDVDNHIQRHYIGHTDDIKSIAVHTDGEIVATGQTAGRDKETAAAHIRVWSSTTLETLHIIGAGTLNRCVNALAFSKEDNGAQLAVVDDAPEPKLSLWNWEDETLITESKASADPILAVTFSPDSPSRIITTGKNHLAFWQIDSSNGRLSRRMGIFGSHEKPKYVTSIGFMPEVNQTVTGDSNGTLMVWKNGGTTVINSKVGVHDGAIFCVIVTPDNNFITAGKDQRIVELDQQLEPTGRETMVPEEYGSPRQVVMCADHIIVGTTKNAILRGSFDEDFTTITRGHLEELWGLTVHPSEKKFLTAGRDGMVYLRDATTHTVEWYKDFETPCQSAAFAPNGEVVVIGCCDGSWKVMDIAEQNVIHQGQDGDEAHQMIKFSPDGNKLALGSRDNNIYIYQVDDNATSYIKYGNCKGHASFITHFDWSVGQEYIQTNSGDYEHLFWNINDDCSRADVDDTKDVQWVTNTCLLCFNNLGIWPDGVDGTDINSCNSANELNVVATGDDFGKVKLFNSPACYQHMSHHSYLGHSSHVTTVQFLNDDSFVVSTGGRDTAVIQWKLTTVEGE